MPEIKIAYDYENHYLVWDADGDGRFERCSLDADYVAAETGADVARLRAFLQSEGTMHGTEDTGTLGSAGHYLPTEAEIQTAKILADWRINPSPPDGRGVYYHEAPRE